MVIRTKIDNFINSRLSPKNRKLKYIIDKKEDNNKTTNINKVINDIYFNNKKNQIKKK